MSYTIWPHGPTGDVLAEVFRERLRQAKLKDQGRFAYTVADPEMGDLGRLAILTEELGEVARCVAERAGLANDKHGESLEKELVQVAAICVAWLEAEARGHAPQA